MPKRIRYRHSGDILKDAPPTVDTCRKWCAWQARQRGDILTEVEAIRVQMVAFFCAWEVAIERGLELIPDIDRGSICQPLAWNSTHLPKPVCSDSASLFFQTPDDHLDSAPDSSLDASSMHVSTQLTIPICAEHPAIEKLTTTIPSPRTT